MAQQILNNGESGLTHRTKLNDNFTDLYTNKAENSVTVNGQSLTGNVTLDQDDIADGTTAKQYTATEKTKLAGIETGAEVNNISDANATDLTDAGDTTLHFHAADRNRANHTGSEAYIPFDTLAGIPAYAEGQLYYDNTNKTIALQTEFSDVTLQLGGEFVIRALNNTGVTITNGSVVYLSGATGSDFTVALADATNSTTGDVIGVATHDIVNGDVGFITNTGVVNGLNTSSFSAGAAIYLSTTPGQLTATKPSAPDHAVKVGHIGVVSPTVGTLQVGIEHEQDATEVELESAGSATYTTVQQMQDVYHSTGWVTGGTITDNGDGTINVSAGSGYVRKIDNILDTLVAVDWNGVTNQSITTNDTSYVYVNWNAGSPTIQVTTTERTTFNTTDILLAQIYRNATTTLHINETVRYTVGDHAGLMIQQLQETAPLKWASGAAISESGVRNISLTAGVFWNGLNRFTTDAFDSSSADTFTYWYRDGASGWTSQLSESQINNTQYDNNSGTLATLNNNEYGVHWVFLSTDSDVDVIFGRGTYTLANAQAAGVPGDIPPQVAVGGRLVGKIIIQKSAATFTSTESPFTTTFTTGGVTNHNSLSGLQGGTTSEYYHLTSAEYSGLVTATNTKTLTNKTIDADGTGNVITNIGSSEVKAELISGLTEDVSPVTGDFVMTYDTSAGGLKKVDVANLPTSGGGEINTASNIGTAGVGVFDAKVGVDLQFKKINNGSTKVSITDDTINNEIDVDVVEANLSLNNIGGTLNVAKGGTGTTTSTGTGSVVLSTSPTLTTPNLGTPSAVTLTNAIGLPLTTGVTGTLPIANGGTGNTAGIATSTNALQSATTTINVSSATAPTTGQVLTATSSTTATWQTPSSGGSKEIRIRIPGELIADTTTHQGIFWRNTSGATITISNVAFGVSKAAAGSGAAAAFNIYKSSGTITDGIDTNAVNLFTSAVDLTTNNISDTNVPNTTTVENGRWVSLRCTSSAGATNKAQDLEAIITYS